MVDFWVQALNYKMPKPVENGFVILRDPNGNGPDISLDKVETKRIGKRSRLHLDLYAENQEEEVNRLVALGAAKYPWNYGSDTPDYVVLQDPDDNLFCVVQI